MVGIPAGDQMTCVALIPARGGSQRLPGKNLKLLAGHPLIAYTIAAARQAGCCDRIVVSTDDADIARVAQGCWAHVHVRDWHSDAHETDMRWLRPALDEAFREPPDMLMLLRPTAPFRTADTIRRAWAEWQVLPDRFDSMRAVRCVTEHPGKMWVERQGHLQPLLPWLHENHQPWHSNPTQNLPAIYVQTAGLEIVRRDVVYRTGTISGWVIAPFVCEGPEALDLNTLDDWMWAEQLLRDRKAVLPDVGGVRE